MLDTFRQRFDAPGEKCQLEMQVQGRFRKLPEGRLFMGAEISKRMDLGLLTKGLSNRYQHPFLLSLPLFSLPFFSPFHCSLAVHTLVNHDYILLNTIIYHPYKHHQHHYPHYHHPHHQQHITTDAGSQPLSPPFLRRSRQLRIASYHRADVVSSGSPVYHTLFW